MKKLFLIGLLSMGCTTITYHTAIAPTTTTRHIPVYIDGSFSKNETIAIVSGVDAWNNSLNGFITLDVVSTSFDMEIDVIKNVYQSKNGILILNKPIGPVQESWIAWTDHQNEVNYIDGHTINILAYKIRERGKNMRRVAMHEIGHVLSADDNIIPDTLMNRNTNFEPDCIDEEVILQLQKKLHLDPSKTNYCKVFR